MKLGILGGTFNPVHLGHLRAAEDVLEQAGLERIVFIPSHTPPHKDLSGGIAGDLRYRMVELAIRDNPRFAVSDFEIKRTGPSYSINTIRQIASEYGCVPYFIMGLDAFAEIRDWFAVEDVLAETNLIIMSRPGCDRPQLDRLLDGIADYRPAGGKFINGHGRELVFLDVTPLAISSSDIRRRCAAGSSLKYLLPAAVQDLIEKEKIYG